MKRTVTANLYRLVALLTAVILLNEPIRAHDQDVAVGGYDCPSGCLVISRQSGADALVRIVPGSSAVASLGLLQDSDGNAAGCLEPLVIVPNFGENTYLELLSVDACVTNDPGNAYLGSLFWDSRVVETNAVTGSWQRKSQPIGSGDGLWNGMVTNLSVGEVTGLSFAYELGDPVLFASVRVGQGNDGQPDILVRVDTNTGALVSGGFPDGHDFLQLGPVTNGSGEVLFDVENIAFNAAGQLFAIAGNGGPEREFVHFDPLGGKVIDQRRFESPEGTPLPYIHTLTFDPVRDNFLAVAGPLAGTLSNHIFRISLSGLNVGSVVEDAFGTGTNSVPIAGAGEYHGLSCYLVTPSAAWTLDGLVFVDEDRDKHRDPGEAPYGNAGVFLFEDLNGNHRVDRADAFIDFTLSDSNGAYQVVVVGGRDYLLAMNQAGLPTNSCAVASAVPFHFNIPYLCGLDVQPIDLWVYPCIQETVRISSNELSVDDAENVSIKLVIHSATNRTYTLEHSTNLLTGSFTNLPGTVERPGSGFMQMFLHTNAAPAGFYRVDVK